MSKYEQIDEEINAAAQEIYVLVPECREGIKKSINISNKSFKEKDKLLAEKVDEFNKYMMELNNSISKANVKEQIQVEQPGREWRNLTPINAKKIAIKCINTSLIKQIFTTQKDINTLAESLIKEQKNNIEETLNNEYVYVQRPIGFVAGFEEIRKEIHDEIIYQKAVDKYNTEQYYEAKVLFNGILEHKDSLDYVKKCDQLNNKQQEEESQRIKEKENQVRLIAGEKEQQEERKRTKEQTKALVAKAGQYLAFIGTLIMVVVFGVMLFANRTRIAAVGSYETWVILWILFTLSLGISSIVFLVRMKDGEQKVAASIISAITIFVIIIVGVNFAKMPQKGADENLDIIFTSKTTSGSNVELHFSITNNNPKTVTAIDGDMIVCDKNNFTIDSFAVTFSGYYISTTTHSVYVTIYSTSDSELVRTSYDDLTIKFKIKSVSLDYNALPCSGEMKTIKKGSSSSSGSTTANSSGTPSLESSLYQVAGYNAILPTAYEVYIGYSSNFSFTYNGATYTSFFADFKVPTSDKNTYVDLFIQKLANNDYDYDQTITLYGTESYILKKGNTRICISDVIEDEGEYYVCYYVWRV